eukprot:m.301942 g.301942  ORF g.301942 m.301942 type:complete len:430 (+) comp14976_c0_seq1:102-1391(+)
MADSAGGAEGTEGTEADFGNHLQFRPEDYDLIVERKVAWLRQLFGDLYNGDIAVFPSAPCHFRMKSRFVLLRDEALPGRPWRYAMWENRRPTANFTAFPPACESINALMPRLLAELDARPAVTAQLRGANFHATTAGDMVVTLGFQRGTTFDEEFERAFHELGEALGVKMVAKARGQRLVHQSDVVQEEMVVGTSRLLYRQIEGSFSNPNAGVNVQVLQWLRTVVPVAFAAGVRRGESAGESGESGESEAQPALLELYSGCCNHSVALAKSLPFIVAVELDRRLCDMARANLELNGIANVHVEQIDSHDFCLQLLETRQLHVDRIDQTFRFHAILVDPPRTGLDAATLELVKTFDFIIWISCAPEVLLTNLTDATRGPALSETHDLIHLAFADQFAFTQHSEAVILLQRKALPADICLDLKRDRDARAP